MIKTTLQKKERSLSGLSDLVDKQGDINNNKHVYHALEGQPHLSLLINGRCSCIAQSQTRRSPYKAPSRLVQPNWTDQMHRLLDDREACVSMGGPSG
jgi:hypothetical protein